MRNSAERAVAIVGVSAILPEAHSAEAFWDNIVSKRYCISEVPQDRWNAEQYYDPNPSAPDKTYCKIGGWITGFEFDWRRFRLPPKVADAMDESQKWAVTIAADALEDYGYPERPLNLENTAVIFGTAMGGEQHYVTHLRIMFPEYAQALEQVDEFGQLPAEMQATILSEWRSKINSSFPPITEDSMPGELPNIVSGRVANLLNLRGPNFITDAACASSFAAINSAIEMLSEHQVDAVLTGGVDHNMGVSSFVKFCKIGALSATGSRPFGEGADGFVMGEGAAAFLLKRLEDAERAGDRIYAVIRGVGGSSDGKGKGITAPNPIGQRLAIERAWENSGLDPATATLVEAHGTSTRVGDVVELQTLSDVFAAAPNHSIALGSAKGNIGHLKAGAGAAGLLKAALALHRKVLPPTLNAERPNPNADFRNSPFFLIHEAQSWIRNDGSPLRCGVSAYGFGGTNFHVVLEEHQPGILTARATDRASRDVRLMQASAPLEPVRGILALGANTPQGLAEKVEAVLERVRAGWTPPRRLPQPATLKKKERLLIDFDEREELLDRLQKAQKVMGFDTASAWKAMQAQGIFRGRGQAQGKVAFLFPGQGSQYVNMGRELTELSTSVAEVFRDADEIMEPILGKPLTAYIFVDPDDSAAVMQAQIDLMQTEITQPAMLTLDIAMLRLLADYGFEPDVVMGHSLGEYAALIASGVMPFADALEAAAARGSEMSKVSWDDNGKMAAVLAPFEDILSVLEEVDGYVVPANINSLSQCVIGGASEAVEEAVELFEERGYRALMLPVSHAFHTKIVAPASQPLRQVLDRLAIAEPKIPVVANVDGNFYPTTVEAIKDNLELQVASTVQWVNGLHTLYDYGVRTFVEVGPKRALRGFANDVFADNDDVQALMTNHPKFGTLQTFNQALCGLYAAGFGLQPEVQREMVAESSAVKVPPETEPAQSWPLKDESGGEAASPVLMELLTQALDAASRHSSPSQETLYDRELPPSGSVVISGTGLGLPGAEKAVMDPDNAIRLLQGEQFVDLIPERFRHLMVQKRVTRLVKGADGSGSFETITGADEVIKLAGRPGSFDLASEYGVPGKLIEALDITTQLAMAAGLDALREAGIPLVQTYRKTSTAKYLPDRWLLPEALRDETAVIFASAFPGGDRFADELQRYYAYTNRLSQLEMLEELRGVTTESRTLEEIGRRQNLLRDELEREPYQFDRRFIFRILCMGHSQFAQYIGARGPNAHVNAACASTAQGVALAEDWIRTGRCRRAIVIAADNVTGDGLMEWVGAGFLAVGAATTKDQVAQAALPFDKRRHGTILGMGACALVVESEDALRERGMRGIAELLSSETLNSAFHGTRLDVSHISQVMNDLITTAERRFGLQRTAMAAQTVFMSHETYTPARGGSASAEIMALRKSFGDAAGEIIIANTKGFTGHPMGVGVEDVIAIKILEHGIVPPVPNFKEIDPDLGTLNLSRGGRYPVKYALHLAAGFGSQIAMTLTRKIPGHINRLDDQPRYRRWLADMSGYNRPETEVEKRVLRIKAQGYPSRDPAPSSWRKGTGPQVRVVFGDVSVEAQPRRPAAQVVAPMTPQAEPMTTLPLKQAPPIESHPQPSETLPPTHTVSGTSLESVPAMPLDPPVMAEDIAKQAADPVRESVVALVADMTGYPPDMLDLDLDLEADLGIDTVKQAETFAAITETFDLPPRDDLNLRDYATLGAVIEFVKEMRPDLATTAPESTAFLAAIVDTTAPPAPQEQVPISPADDSISAQVIELVAMQTGYPPDMLDLDLDLEADLGIDTVKQAETFAAIQETFDLQTREELNLRDYATLGAVIEFVKTMRPDLDPSSHASLVESEAFESVDASDAGQMAAPTSDDTVADRVIELVAEQTGYPPDMLDLDLDLEADLGIDTVKQAETFAAIQETFELPSNDDLNLRDYSTLGAVIGFVKAMRPDLGEMATVSDGNSEANNEIDAEPASNEPVAMDEVSATIIQLVSEQTGYPPDMLEPDLDLEADLGIDTVKQAETFAAIQETFELPTSDDLNLREYSTLGAVIQFVKDMRPDLVRPIKAAKGPAVESGQSSGRFGASVTAPGSPEAAAAASDTDRSRAGDDLTAADKMPRRIPVPAVRPSLEICQSTGVSLSKGSRVIIAGDKAGVGRSLRARLERLDVEALVLDPTGEPDTLLSQIDSWLAAGPIQGLYWLPAMDDAGGLEEMSIAEWRFSNRVRVKALAVVARALYNSLSAPGTFLLAGTRMGGQHGYDVAGASAPLGGGVTGFIKSFKRERPDVLVKCVDFEESRKTARPADLLVAETLSDPGAVEVGYRDDRRFGVTLLEKPAADGSAGLILDPSSIFLVTGAAGGITSAIVGDLAAASGGTFYLLDLVPTPAKDDPYIELFRQDRDALRSRLIEDAREEGQRPTPALIEKELMAVERREAALTAIESVEAAGGRAIYYSVDLLDGPKLAAIVETIRQQHGRLSVLIHAGGIEISRALPDKAQSQFDLVYDIKTEGFFNLLSAAVGLPIDATVVFSSVAGRFGNAGQTDYSSANDLLCKISSSMRRWRPDTRAIIIDWTAWGEIGMATRGSIPKIMEMAGIEMLPPASGIPTVRRELTASAFRGELLVAGKLGVLTTEEAVHGGIDLQKANLWLRDEAHGLVMVGEVTHFRQFGGLTVAVTLDPLQQPFLYNHALDGTPLLPGVMGTEGFAEIAACCLPDYVVQGIENMRMDAAVKFFHNEPQTLFFDIAFIPLNEDEIVAKASLRTVRQLPQTDLPPVEKVHFQAEVLMARDSIAPPSIPFTPPEAAELNIDPSQIYAVYFHGPAYQVLSGARSSGDTAVGLMASELPPNSNPADSRQIVAPRLIELCFQTAGVWDIATHRRMALPLAYTGVKVYRAIEPRPNQAFYALVKARDDGVEFDAQVVDESGQLYLSLHGYRTVALPGEVTF